jgi:hypothetical protein
MATGPNRHRSVTATQSSFYDDRFEQPDAELLALSRAVNDKCRTGRVTFFGTRFEDGVHWSAIFQDGSRRATINLQGRPVDDDLQDIITALESWAGFRIDGSPYSTEPPKPPADEWFLS